MRLGRKSREKGKKRGNRQRDGGVLFGEVVGWPGLNVNDMSVLENRDDDATPTSGTKADAPQKKGTHYPLRLGA